MNSHSLIKEKNAKYPFMISNTERSNENGAHWWSILDSHPTDQSSNWVIF